MGLNPIVLVWGLGGDHNDFLMMFFIVLGFYLLLRARAAAQAARAGTDAGASAGADAAAGERRVRLEELTSLRRVRAALWPPAPLELGAGAALVTAVGIKASAAVLVPVVLAGLAAHATSARAARARHDRRGRRGGGREPAGVRPAHPRPEHPGELVTSESVPNLIGLAAGAGGETAGLRTALSGVLILLVLGCCWVALGSGKRWSAPGEAGGAGRAIAASGWASVALLVTLSWVLPWYVLWVLPLAALAGSRRLRTTALVLGVYLIVAWSPASGLLWNAIGFYPEKTPLGRLHQRSVKELLD